MKKLYNFDCAEIVLAYAHAKEYVKKFGNYYGDEQVLDYFRIEMFKFKISTTYPLLSEEDFNSLVRLFSKYNNETVFAEVCCSNILGKVSPEDRARDLVEYKKFLEELNKLNINLDNKINFTYTLKNKKTSL